MWRAANWKFGGNTPFVLFGWRFQGIAAMRSTCWSESTRGICSFVLGLNAFDIESLSDG